MKPISASHRLVWKKFKKKCWIQIIKCVSGLYVPVKILKANSNIFSEFLHNAFSNSIKSFKFPSILKLADKTVVHKKLILKYKFFG